MINIENTLKRHIKALTVKHNPEAGMMIILEKKDIDYEKKPVVKFRTERGTLQCKSYKRICTTQINFTLVLWEDETFPDTGTLEAELLKNRKISLKYDENYSFSVKQKIRNCREGLKDGAFRKHISLDYDAPIIEIFDTPEFTAGDINTSGG